MYTEQKTDHTSLLVNIRKQLGFNTHPFFMANEQKKNHYRSIKYRNYHAIHVKSDEIKIYHMEKKTYSKMIDNYTQYQYKPKINTQRHQNAQEDTNEKTIDIPSHYQTIGPTNNHRDPWQTETYNDYVFSFHPFFLDIYHLPGWIKKEDLKKSLKEVDGKWLENTISETPYLNHH